MVLRLLSVSAAAPLWPHALPPTGRAAASHTSVSHCLISALGGLAYSEYLPTSCVSHLVHDIVVLVQHHSDALEGTLKESFIAKAPCHSDLLETLESEIPNLLKGMPEERAGTTSARQVHHCTVDLGALLCRAATTADLHRDILSIFYFCL